MFVFWFDFEYIIFFDLIYLIFDGFLVVGGDLFKECLLLVYCNGIFLWYVFGDLILWWCFDLCCVFFFEDLKVFKSMCFYFNQCKFEVIYDWCFMEVMLVCV